MLFAKQNFQSGNWADEGGNHTLSVGTAEKIFRALLHHSTTEAS